MDEKLKILLGSEDIISRDNEDIYLNINLNRSFAEYKLEKYDNDYNLATQFNIERNKSRNFFIYGIVDSNIIDCNNYPIKAYSNSSLTNLVYSTYTTSMNLNGDLNIFNKKRGKYFIPLTNYTGNSIFIVIQSDNNNIKQQVFEQGLVFYESDGEFIPYGTETVEIDSNFNSTDINNNFPFFYNKHWVKKNISLQQEKKAKISFNSKKQSVSEGGDVSVLVKLDKPSPFGNESMVLKQAHDSSFNNFLVFCGTTSNILSTNTILDYSIGEQTKTITFRAINNNTTNTNRDFTFSLDSLNSVLSGTFLTQTITISD